MDCNINNINNFIGDSIISIDDYNKLPKIEEDALIQQQFYFYKKDNGTIINIQFIKKKDKYNFKFQDHVANKSCYVTKINNLRLDSTIKKPKDKVKHNSTDKDIVISNNTNKSRINNKNASIKINQNTDTSDEREAKIDFYETQLSNYSVDPDYLHEKKYPVWTSEKHYHLYNKYMESLEFDKFLFNTITSDNKLTLIVDLTNVWFKLNSSSDKLPHDNYVLDILALIESSEFNRIIFVSKYNGDDYNILDQIRYFIDCVENNNNIEYKSGQNTIYLKINNNLGEILNEIKNNKIEIEHYIIYTPDSNDINRKIPIKGIGKSYIKSYNATDLPDNSNIQKHLYGFDDLFILNLTNIYSNSKILSYDKKMKEDLLEILKIDKSQIANFSIVIEKNTLNGNIKKRVDIFDILVEMEKDTYFYSKLDYKNIRIELSKGFKPYFNEPKIINNNIYVNIDRPKIETENIKLNFSSKHMKKIFNGVTKNPDVNEYNTLIKQKVDSNKEFILSEMGFKKDNSLVLNYNKIKDRLEQPFEKVINFKDNTSHKRWIHLVSHMDTILKLSTENQTNILIICNLQDKIKLVDEYKKIISDNIIHVNKKNIDYYYKPTADIIKKIRQTKIIFVTLESISELLNQRSIIPIVNFESNILPFYFNELDLVEYNFGKQTKDYLVNFANSLPNLNLLFYIDLYENGILTSYNSLIESTNIKIKGIDVTINNTDFENTIQINSVFRFPPIVDRSEMYFQNYNEFTKNDVSNIFKVQDNTLRSVKGALRLPYYNKYLKYKSKYNNLKKLIM